MFVAGRTRGAPARTLFQDSGPMAAGWSRTLAGVLLQRTRMSAQPIAVIDLRSFEQATASKNTAEHARTHVPGVS